MLSVSCTGSFGGLLDPDKAGRVLEGGWMDSEISRWFLHGEDVDSKHLCRQDG